MHLARRLLALTVVVAGCSDQPGAPDARPPCWIPEATTPGGSLELGTGEFGFEPMPDPLRVVYGSQGGFHMVVNTRVTGMLAGNPSDVNDPGNPRTRFRAFFVDTGVNVNGAECPIRLAYKPSAGSTQELLVSSAILFEIGYPEHLIFGREIRIEAEIIDAAGTYARDEKTIRCAAPEGWQSMVDAGV
ncbi:MAG: hypothetical protein JWP01_1847 [Myxococcales bacterium]|nr:hypothetical protein [Myxococcales bacterium]